MSNLLNYSKVLVSILKYQPRYNYILPKHLHMQCSRYRPDVTALRCSVSRYDNSTKIPPILLQDFKVYSPLNFCSKRKLNLAQNLFCSTKEKADPIDDQTENSLDSDQKNLEKEKELNSKIENLSKEVEELKDKYQRSLAERENLRQRLEKQISDSKLFGIQSFCKDLLEVTDVFRKAIESVPEEEIKDADPTFVSLYDGVVMTENQLINVFRRHGVVKIVPKEGDKFDPSQQEAMFEVPSGEGKTPGTVAHVVRTGWKLHDRCVRSAQVGVVKE